MFACLKTRKGDIVGFKLPVRNSELTPFEEVVWPERRQGVTKAIWDRNVAFVRMLISMGKVLKWASGPAAEMWGEKMPHEYYIDGMKVGFLPHWGQWEVGSFKFQKFPASRENILKVIGAVRILMSFKGSSI